jgi:hypothetical protein
MENKENHWNLYKIQWKFIKYNLINILFIVIIYFSYIINYYSNNRKQIIIFTFWEPKLNIPGYIKLCIRTWQNIFPNEAIIILDYSNLYHYLRPSLISKILCKNMKMTVQADAIRVAILKKYGGIWMDADTIVTNSSFIKRFYDYELVTLSYHIGFIYATKYSIFISKWLRKIIKGVNIYKKALSKNLTKEQYKYLNRGDYLGNFIFNPIVKESKGKEYLQINKIKMYAFPEIIFIKDKLNAEAKYKMFYFSKGDPKKIIDNNQGIIMLHNSWTPNKYKKMSEEEFLKQDIMLAHLLRQILRKKI